MQYIKLIIECENTFILEENLEEYCASIIVNGVENYENFSGNILELNFSRWELKLFPKDLSTDDLCLQIKNVCNIFNISIVEIATINDDHNYVLLNQQSQTYEFNNVIIYNNLDDFNTNKILKNQKIPIYISQSMGFGTGKHFTTALCINLIEELFENSLTINKALDVGCGSGILALIIAKLFKNINILATDIDSIALDVANNFFLLNNEDKIQSLLSNGFDNIKDKNYNLIVANILMEPLITMKQDFYNSLDDRGYLIISGFLNTQNNEILDNFTKVGFKVKKQLQKEEWCAILLQKITYL